MRTVIVGSEAWILLDGSAIWWVSSISFASGAPGIGGRNMPAANAISLAMLGPWDNGVTTPLPRDEAYSWSQDANGNSYVGTDTTTLDVGTSYTRATQTVQTQDGYGNVPPQACTTTAMPAHGRIPTLTSIRTTGVEAPGGVTFEEDAVGGIFGRWAQPAETREGSAILHLDYRLAREGPFPAAVEDAEACCGGLVDRGIRNIALSGDSAGGNLALVLLSIATAQKVSALKRPDSRRNKNLPSRKRTAPKYPTLFRVGA